MASPSLKALPARPQTFFPGAGAGTTIDLRVAPFMERRADWTHPSEYGPCQALGRAARRAAVALIRYESVRDPEHGGCAALLTPTGFRQREPLSMQTWLLEVRTERITWLATSLVEDTRFEFEFAA
jgi:hypothetical protein